MHTFSKPEELASFAKEHLDRVRAARARVDSLEAFDAIGADLDSVANAAALLRSVHPDVKIREAAEKAEQDAAALATDLSLDRGLYDSVAAIAAKTKDADPATRHYLDKTLRDFRRAGVDKDAATRDRIKALNEELVKIGQEFDANIRNDVRSILVPAGSLAGLPADWIAAHGPDDKGMAKVTTDYPDYVPFMTYAHDGNARRDLYKASRSRAVPKNLEVLQSLLAKRHELATLLGYSSWAAYVTEDKMIGSDANAAEFIEKIARASEKRMKADYAQLLARKRKDDEEATEVFDWERAYYEDRVSAESYQFEAQALRPYFEYHRVKQGIFDVTEKMFGVRYAKSNEKTWHADVESFDLFDAATGAALGRFHLDMHPREGKYKHAAMFPVVTGREGAALPEAALVCNFPQAPPALLEHDDVKTFFHEFGHLLHHLLGGHIRWSGVSGIRTEWDFVEAPSQMLEEWAFDLDTLRTFAKHVETGEAIPAEHVQKLRAASEFGKGLQVRHQMYYAKLSLELYRRAPPVDSTALSRELMNRYSPFHYVDGTAFEASFGHLDGYSAIYYTYMWSLVIAKDLFGEFRKSGLLDRKTCGKYRAAVLAPGGSRPAAALVREFLGREVEFSSFESWLNEG